MQGNTVENITQSINMDDLVYSPGAGRLLVPYASIPEQSRGRLYEEPSSLGRSPFQRDRDRIIHAAAFRRLEYKTQVFVYNEGDHYRTRLTHSLEVAQLARSVARELLLDEDLAEAIALSHDIGHAPFGHAGEDALEGVMAGYGGFDHNAQAIRIVTHLEDKYAKFRGLNLTWECLEGMAKHNGPIIKEGSNESTLPRGLKVYNDQHNLELKSYAGLEAQVAALCDDIAYNTHDIEDGLRAGLISVEDVLEVPLVGRIFLSVKKEHPNISRGQMMHESRRRLIYTMVRDLVRQTQERIASVTLKNVDDVRNQQAALAAMSDDMVIECNAIKSFLSEKMYHHYRVNRMTVRVKRVVRDLFEFFMKEPGCLPTDWRVQAEAEALESQERAVIVADFIAGMTDRFALAEYGRAFDVSYKLLDRL